LKEAAIINLPLTDIACSSGSCLLQPYSMIWAWASVRRDKKIVYELDMSHTSEAWYYDVSRLEIKHFRPPQLTNATQSQECPGFSWNHYSGRPELEPGPLKTRTQRTYAYDPGALHGDASDCGVGFIHGVDGIRVRTHRKDIGLYSNKAESDEEDE
jgi:hypothetical protein